jgi:signal transduction histidine kinase
MTGLKMDLSWIRRRVLDLGYGLPDAVAQRMTQMNGLLEDAIHTVRKIAGQLRPAILDDLGLVPAMEWQAREFSERTGIPCELVVGMEELALNRESATELFRIYQEMLTNVARHARATRVEIRMELSSGVLILEVEDNGCGIHIQDVERRTSLGILGMEERAKRIGATLSIQPRPEGGTTACVRVPVGTGGPA